MKYLISYLLQELDYVLCAHQPRRSLALDYVYMILDLKNVRGTFWFVIGCPPTSFQDGGHFQSRLWLGHKFISTDMVKLYIIGKEISC